jgi:hypothetical protein
MNCPICFEENDDMYTIACGSNTPHQICHSCEISMRCSATLTNEGRFIKCPLCRAVEPTQGNRTIKSYEVERVYNNLQVAARSRFKRNVPQSDIRFVGYPLVRVATPPAPLEQVATPPEQVNSQWCLGELR